MNPLGPCESRPDIQNMVSAVFQTQYSLSLSLHVCHLCAPTPELETTSFIHNEQSLMLFLVLKVSPENRIN